MTNVLVIGGAGYIGSHAIKELMKSGFTPIAFDNLYRGHRDAVLCPDFTEGDLVNIDDIRSVFKNHQIDAVMHFAAMAYVGESVSDPEKYYINNVVGGLNLLRVMMEGGIKKLIFSSTAAVYGEPNTTPIPESHPKEPINPYGVTKYLFERAMEDYSRAYGLRYVSLRYFNAAGADPDGELGERHDPETHLIPLTLMAAGGKTGEIIIYGDDYPTPDGTCIRDYIHITDLISAHTLSLGWLLDGGVSRIFNLGNESGHSVKEVIEACKGVTKRDFKVRIGDRRPGDPPVLVASSEKIKSELGWEPSHNDLSDIIKSAWDFMLKKGIVR